MDSPAHRYGGDRWLMDQALRMARRGLGTTAPNPSVGAVVFDPAAGEIVGRGVTQPGGRPHAEPVAIAAAGARARGATLAVTLEPCSHHGRSPPCVDAVLGGGIAKVVYAQVDPDPRVAGRGLERLRAEGVVTVACAPDQWREAAWITRGHILRVTERRPFVQLKLVVGPDGRVAAGSQGTPTWVTGPLARAAGHKLRAQADAILVGHGTLKADDPELTCRLEGLGARSPVRVVAGPRPGEETRLMRMGGAPVWWIAGAAEAADGGSRATLATSGGLTVSRVGGRVWLPSLMEALVERGITRLMVEGGPAIWRAFADARLVDEVVLFHARAQPDRPVDAGDAQQALAHYIGAQEAPHMLRFHARRPVAGDDMFLYRSDIAKGWTARQRETD